MYSHRQALSIAYLAATLFFGYVVVRDFGSILATQRAFFDLGPEWYATVSTIVIVLAPIGFLVTALALFVKADRWIVAIPAFCATVFTLGYITIALVVYLFWFLVIGYRETVAGAEN